MPYPWPVASSLFQRVKMPQLSAVALSTLVCGMASGFCLPPSPPPALAASLRTYLCCRAHRHGEGPGCAPSCGPKCKPSSASCHTRGTALSPHVVQCVPSVDPSSQKLPHISGEGEGRGGLSGELELWGVGRMGQEVKGIRALGICDL